MITIEPITPSAREMRELAELFAAAASADGHEPVGEHKFLHVQRGEDRAEAFVARDGGRAVGYAHLLAYRDTDGRRASAELVVHPDARGRGVGRRLLDTVTQAAKHLGARRLDVWAYNHSATGRGLASTLGFAPARRLLHLHRHMDCAPAAPPLPHGTVIRSFRPEDADAFLALNARVFASHPEQGTWDRDDLAARMSQPWFDPHDFLLLEAGGRLVGFAWLKVQERVGEGRVGEIYVIGVDEKLRGRGLGRTLLSHGLAHLAHRGVDVAAIYVDASNPEALALYDSAGFHYHHVDVCYTLDLDAGTGRMPRVDAA
jgi:mycothiol synthase